MRMVASERSSIPGDTLLASSKVIGLKENSNGKTGTVWVETSANKDDGREVLRFNRWVMVKKREPEKSTSETFVPTLPDHVPADRLNVPPGLRPRHYDRGLAGSMHRFESYAVGEKIDHIDGMTIDEAEHRLATRLYQNTARVHFNAHQEKDGRFGRCIVYGGHVLSIGASTLVQRPRQRPPCRRDQRRNPRQPSLRRRHRLCLVGDPGQSRNRRPPGPWRPSHPPGRHQGPPLRRLPAQGRRRQVRPRRSPRLRLLGHPSPLVARPLRGLGPRHLTGRRRTSQSGGLCRFHLVLADVDAVSSGPDHAMEDGVAIGAMVIDDEAGLLVGGKRVRVIKIASVHPKT